MQQHMQLKDFGYDATSAEGVVAISRVMYRYISSNLKNTQLISREEISVPNPITIEAVDELSSNGAEQTQEQEEIEWSNLKSQNTAR